MMERRKIYGLIAAAAFCMMLSCRNIDGPMHTEEDSYDVINIAGVDADGLMVATKAAPAGVDAETVDWLLGPLTAGLDVTYGLYGGTSEQKSVAVLKLTDNKTTPATYSFKYKNDESYNAKWYDNGYHFFQGAYVPAEVRYTSDISEVETKAPGLTTDQHIGTVSDKNYTLLHHYLAMPADYHITATVERIKLPFRHRLARVIAFVLIDPEMGTTLKDYTTNVYAGISFAHVKVLQGVHDVEVDRLHTLTPQWTEARTVVPHFEGDLGSYDYSSNTSLADDFLCYVKEDNDKVSVLYPTSKNWDAVHNASSHGGYTEINFGKVPVYDVIVRPTYTDVNHVMYDEEGFNNTTTRQNLAKETNKILFGIELQNGLSYEKEFVFDLDANYQTVVYLRISREQIDYDDSGAEVWLETEKNDAWYGMDNESGQTLSKVGGGWQRAYTYGATVDETRDTENGVTDGKFYNASSSPAENEHAQYFTSKYKAMWIERFLQAYQGGAHHGDYFALKSNIDIDARLIPENFVFTGHLDAQDSTISLTNTGEPVYKAAETLKELYTKSAGVYTPWTVPTTLYVPVYYTDDELEIVNEVSYVRSTLGWQDTQYIYYTQDEADAENAKPEHHPLTTDVNGKNPGEEGYIETHDMGRYVDDYTPVTTSTVKETIPAHFVVKPGSVRATTDDIKEYIVATNETTPPYPTTIEQLKTAEYYIDDHSGTRFVCPDLYQFAYTSAAYLFAGLDGMYTTNQEKGLTPWEANVHKETNKSTRWVPTLGYRAELLNVKMDSPAVLFKDGAEITGNVQNCWNGTSAIPNNTPAIPEYK